MGVLETQGPCHTIQPEDPEPEQAPLRPAKPKHPAFIRSGSLGDQSIRRIIRLQNEIHSDQKGTEHFKKEKEKGGFQEGL